MLLKLNKFDIFNNEFMTISKEQIEHLANLSRLDVTEKEKGKFSEQISLILDYFEKLNELDVEGVEPLAYVTDLNNVARADKTDDFCTSDKVLAEAPELEKRQVKVKPVF